MSATSAAMFLQQAQWFQDLPEHLRTEVLATTSELSVASGEYVVRAGEKIAHWFGTIDGFLQMYVVSAEGAETTIYCLRPGEWGGDGSLLKKEKLQYDLRALTPAQICLIPETTFDTLRHSSISFSNYLCDVLNARMGDVVGMLAATRLGGPELQLARALYMLVDRTSPDESRLPISQHELALISGLSRQRVNRAIKTFNEVAIVRSEPRYRFLTVNVPLLKDYLVGTKDRAQANQSV